MGCIAALTVLISGCASSEKLVVSPPASTPPSTNTEPGDPPPDEPPFEIPVELPTAATSHERKAAARLLRYAKRKLLRSGTGHLSRVVSVGDPDLSLSTRIVRSRGVYDLDRLRSRTTSVLFGDDGEKELRIRLITRGRRSMLRLSEWSCWSVAGPKGTDASKVLFPYEVLGPLKARPVSGNDLDSGLVIATVPMKVAAFLTGPGVNESLHGRVAGLRVPTEIRIRSVRFVEWSLHGIDIKAALDESSIRVGRRIKRALPYLDVRMRLRAPGSRVRVPLPPKDERTRAPLGSDRFASACGKPEVV
jgi:hypothetical protein